MRMVHYSRFSRLGVASFLMAMTTVLSVVLLPADALAQATLPE